MKVIVVSDTHQHTNNLLIKLKEIDNIDLLIHLGDNISDGVKISNDLNVKLIGVCGNCDYETDKFSYEKIVMIEGMKVLLTHGHKFNVKESIDRLYYRAKEIEADIVLFGHSHIPMHTRIENTLYLNPGSASLPKGSSKPSLGILFIEKKIIDFEIVSF